MPQAPAKVHYIPNYVTQAEENYLLHCVAKAPRPKWQQLSGRRLQNWGGLPHTRGMMPEPLPDWLAKPCQQLVELGAFAADASPNHVLVNEYAPGQGIMPHFDGPLYKPLIATLSLGSHTLLDFYQLTNSQEDNEQQTTERLVQSHKFSLLLEPRSLVLLQEDMYCQYMHGIAERSQDIVCADIESDGVGALLLNRAQLGVPIVEQGTPVDAAGKSADRVLSRDVRVSLTIRHVPKVFKFKLGWGKK